ncbi:hypothetical protein Halha_0883 [Halobacteroides halobius DSM 5150]|uniref:DUF116 domain-containing protein n=1 Tax=Halobacteroides halobius (strain ATCC 35273 / DSM 5150 / MD-1) TaxID=748449 RepID=L0K930_HALHC|nr:DUF116 domain-containing protein [Halobacteroides halobius]AGB40849.1 hypothetical protein Halha_0883 [Halobacteroides halobius DSM 5150]
MQKSSRLFIGLLLLVLTVVGVLIGGIWYLNFFGFNILSQGVLVILGIIISLVGAILVLGVLGILLTSRRGSPVPILVLPTKIVLSYFLPVVIQLGKLIGFEKEEIMSSFIKVGNQLIDPEELDVKPDDVLILTPHCIQWSECSYRVTSDLDNCQHCGRCQVQDLIDLKEKYGINLAIATGGTLARKIIKETRPKVIVAIACERDLSSGMQDVYPLPVVGVVNLRPNGPCFNTKVELEKIEEAIERILN